VRAEGDAAAQGEYYDAAFSFNLENGGTMDLLWNREGGRWRLVSYRVIEQ